MLHDIWSYKTGDPTDHAHLSAQEAERILEALSCFTAEEITVTCTSIARHRAKEACDGDMDEVLKDADVLQHHLYDPALPVHPGEEYRLRNIFNELGLGGGPHVG